MRFTKPKLVVLTVAVILLALSLTFAVPSGAILPTDTTADTWDTDSLFDEDASAKPYRVLASAALSDILPVNDIAELSLDMDTTGRAPVEKSFTDAGYRDNTIIVEITEIKQDNSTYHVAYVKIATPSQLRTFVAGGVKSDRTMPTSVLAKSVNAIVAINGDFYSKFSGGYIVRQGQVVRKKVSDSYDLLLIDENSDFHLVKAGTSIQKTAITQFANEHELVNAFFFGPALVIDGQKQEIDKKYGWNPNGKEPRAAIGQLAPLTYVMVSVDGRIADSEGVTLPTRAAFMEQLGCQQAYNLDGGNSSALIFHNTMLTVKDVNERSINDIIYFASATEGE